MRILRTRMIGAAAAAALLMARGGMRVLMVDPRPPSQDTLSTHALMRGGVLQLHRWGLLSSIRAAGTPEIRSTVFDYGARRIAVPIKSKDLSHLSGSKNCSTMIITVERLFK